MLITLTGRKTGRQYTIPVRYMREGATVRCSTERRNLWWRNLRGGAEVELRTNGRDGAFRANVIDDNPEFVKNYLEHFLSVFPQDAPYLGVKMDKSGQLDATSLNAVSLETVVIEALDKEALVLGE